MDVGKKKKGGINETLSQSYGIPTLH